MVRFKNRYILCEIVYPDKDPKKVITANDALVAIKESILENYGDYGSIYSAVLSVKSFNEKTMDLMILRCARAYFRNVWAAMTLVTKINQISVSLRVIHVGGSIKQCQKASLSFYNALQRTHHGGETEK